MTCCFINYYPGIAYLRTVLLTILEYDFIPVLYFFLVKKLQYWNIFLYQYCQQSTGDPIRVIT